MALGVTKATLRGLGLNVLALGTILKPGAPEDYLGDAAERGQLDPCLGLSGVAGVGPACQSGILAAPACSLAGTCSSGQLWSYLRFTSVQRACDGCVCVIRLTPADGGSLAEALVCAPPA